MKSTVSRRIVRIDPELCNGCGECVSPCAEGAIQLVDGKARVLQEELCDGAGFCIGACPTGALTTEIREAVPFDHSAVVSDSPRGPGGRVVHSCYLCGMSEDDMPLLPLRTKGTNVWCCTKCLPALIHG
jgi:NAD-dependent dihydropyrimidine dehydrogenase PreA subunit